MKHIAIHTVAAFIITVISGLAFGDHRIGAAAAIAFYYSREVAQHQLNLILVDGIRHQNAIKKGWFLWEWPTWKKRFEFLAPAAVSVLLFLL